MPPCGKGAAPKKKETRIQLPEGAVIEGEAYLFIVS